MNGDLAYAAPGRYGDADAVHAGNADLAYDGAAMPAGIPGEPAGPGEPEVPVEPAPEVTFCYPRTGSTEGALGVTISGMHLAGATAVTAGPPVASFTAGSDTEITAVTAPGSPGPADVTVTTPAGTGTLPAGFTYQVPPRLESAAPDHGPAGTGITLGGSGLASASTILIGGYAASVSSVTDNAIACTAPDGPDDGPADIWGLTSTAEITLPGGFTYDPAGPGPETRSYGGRA